VVDFRQSNLHVLNYSAPVRAVLPLSELKPHLLTLPEHPDWIPYRTSYYQENWGFCLPHARMLALEDGEYEVLIDSTLEDGHLTYGECRLPGRSNEEVLISCHACHPSLANDNLSGLAVATFLAELLAGRDLRYSYRFLFIPGTIGAITWLARNRETAGRIRHGLVLTCIGDAGGFHYKKSRRGNAEIDRAAAHVLRHHGEPFELLEFSPYGYDERQYCSPGFNLPVGCLMRSVWGSFPEYHTSADNLDFIKPLQLAGSLRVCATIVDVLENNRRYRNQNPYCEPQLGKRGLYRSTGGDAVGTEISARLWVLNLSDGENSLLDIAERSGLPFAAIQDAAELLCRSGLLAAVSDGPVHKPEF
jgi:aminopeptidase-like protein